MISATAYNQSRTLDLTLRMAKRFLRWLGRKGGEPEILEANLPSGSPPGPEPDDDDGKSGDFEQNSGRDAARVPPQDEGEYREDRRATSAGPQLFTLVVDHSASMEGDKAKEATQVLKEVIQYARSLNTGDQTGTKTYFYTQVLLFADKFEDSTGGMKRPPDSLEPARAFTVRASEKPEERARLGNLTNYQKPLAHVYKTLTGKQGMTPKRLAAGMPAPIVLFITDGFPNLPKGTAIPMALKEAERIKALYVTEARCYHPTYEQITYPAEPVRLITIGLGDEQEFDPDLLTQLCTHVQYKGVDLPLYLHCPQAKDLRKIGAQIVGTVTRADQSDKTGNTLEEVIYTLRQSLGKQG